MPPQNTLTPRARIRAAVRTGPTATTSLFMPLTYAVAAQIEALDIRDFLHNPTKLAKGLQTLQQITHTDAIICACAGGMEAEAFGAQLEWMSYPPKVVSHPAQQGTLADSFAGLITRSVRISAALEATRRLTATVQGEPVLVAGLTGPLTLATQLSGMNSQQLAASAEGREILEYAGRFLVELARQFLLAGAHCLVLLEDTLPESQGTLSEAWYATITPIVNTAKFHKALAVLLPMPHEHRQEFLSRLPRGMVGCVPSDGAGTTSIPASAGLMLPTDPTTWQPLEAATAVMTTVGEIPPLTDIGTLRDACVRVWR